MDSSDSDVESVAAVMVTLLALKSRKAKRLQQQKKKKTRKWWVHPSWQLRDVHGMEATVVKDMEKSDPELFFQTFRMSKAQFEFVLGLVTPAIQRQDTVMRESISAKARLGVTLRFLASGDSLLSLALLYRMGKSTVSTIVWQTCSAIWDALQPLYMKPPQSKEAVKLIAKEFEELWQYPQCMGAIDGKHCKVQAPPNSGSDFYCFHGFFSIVLMAICDARYRFLYVDIGAKGKENDSSVFSRSGFGQALAAGRLPIPEPAVLPGMNTEVPFVFVGDEAFPLKNNLMRPINRARVLGLEDKVFNYRLSRCRRVIENAFGILTARFQIFRKGMNCKLENADKVIKATTVLHNYLTTTNAENDNRYISSVFVDREVDGKIIPGMWRDQGGLPSAGNISGNNATLPAYGVRQLFKEYFNGPGAVPWQIESVRNGNY